VLASGSHIYCSGYGDPAMFNSKHDSVFDESPASMFNRVGIWLQPANNQREIGWRNLKQWMHHTEYTPPMLKVLRRCRYLTETIPIMQYKNEQYDLDTKGQDDYVDALRYALRHLQYGYVYNRNGSIVKFEAQIADDNDTFIHGTRDRQKQNTIQDKDNFKRKFKVAGKEITTSVYSIY